MAILSIRPGDSSHLQSALHASQPGDEIVLPAGARYVGQFVFPAKSADTILRTEGFDTQERVLPEDVPRLASIASGVGAMALDMRGAKNWTVRAVRLEPNVGGFGEVVSIQDGERIWLDQILLVVPNGQQQKRGILGNGKHIILTRSYLAGIWRTGQDSQCFAAWDGAGPYAIADNYLEAASENILFGGADASSVENIPEDILIERNHFTKNLAWKGQPRQVKNLLELKCAKRVLIRGNTFEHNWADAQSGFAVLFTPRNQDGTAPFSVIEDVTFEQNTLRDSPLGLNITGYDDLNLSGQTTRIIVRDNVIETPGIGCLIHHNVGSVAVYRNDFGPATDRAILSMDANGHPYAADDLTWAENKGGGYIHAPTATGETALYAYTGKYSLTVPSDGPAPLPALPAPVDGLPVPTPGTVVEAPSVPKPDVQAQIDKMHETINILANGITRLQIAAEAEAERVVKLVAYLQATPKSLTRIYQVINYIRGVK